MAPSRSMFGVDDGRDAGAEAHRESSARNRALLVHPSHRHLPSRALCRRRSCPAMLACALTSLAPSPPDCARITRLTARFEPRALFLDGADARRPTGSAPRSPSDLDTLRVDRHGLRPRIEIAVAAIRSPALAKSLALGGGDVVEQPWARAMSPRAAGARKKKKLPSLEIDRRKTNHIVRGLARHLAPVIPRLAHRTWSGPRGARSSEVGPWFPVPGCAFFFFVSLSFSISRASSRVLSFALDQPGHSAGRADLAGPAQASSIISMSPAASDAWRRGPPRSPNCMCTEPTVPP